MKPSLIAQAFSFLPVILSFASIDKNGKLKPEKLKLFDGSTKEAKLKSALGSLPEISEALKKEIQHYALFAGASYCGPEAKTKKYDELCNMKYSGDKAKECFQKRKKLISKEKCRYCKIKKDEYRCCSGTSSQENSIDSIIDEETNPRAHVETGIKTEGSFKSRDKRNNKPDSNLTFQCKYCDKIDTNITRVWNGDLDDAAIIAKDEARNQIVVAFRGSHDYLKFMSSTVTHKTSYKFGDNLSVNELYLRNFQNLYPKLLKNIKRIINDSNGRHTLVLVGHSLGGAIATLAAPYFAEDLNLSPSNIKIFTFGQPRTGNRAFAKWYNGQKYNFIRVVNSKDPVVDFPSRDDNWAHVHNEVWIHQSKYFDCKTSKLENPKCSLNSVLAKNKKNHSYVDKTFLSIDECSNRSHYGVGAFFDSIF